MASVRTDGSFEGGDRCYWRLEEFRRFSNKKLTVTRELLERIRTLKDYVKLGKQKSFQHVSGDPGVAYNPFVNEEARDSFFDFEQAIILDFWVERLWELEMKTSEQLHEGACLSSFQLRNGKACVWERSLYREIE